MVQPQHIHRPPLRSALEAHVTVTASTYTAKAGDCLIGVNRSGAVTVTLPTTQIRTGRIYTIKDQSGAASTNNITVATEGSENIDGAATDTISENHGSKTYYSDGSNWFTVPLLAVGSHSLASHSAKAHSDLTGVGTDDHHAGAHQAGHNSGGADALKLDDLAAPDDNTDLDVSTTAHGLVPKGANTGNFLKDDGTWAAPSGGPSQATQAALEAETDEDTYVPPDLIKHSPGVAKVWCKINSNGSLASPDCNVDSITDTGTGDRTIVWGVDFSGTVYATVAALGSGVSNADASVSTYAAGSHRVETFVSGALTDATSSHAIFGDQ